jgi:hypothetical protein
MAFLLIVGVLGFMVLVAVFALLLNPPTQWLHERRNKQRDPQA